MALPCLAAMASEPVPSAVAILLAAGAGRRLGAVDQPKAFVPIGGRPILSVAAAAAAASPAVDRLVITVPVGWEDYARGCVEFCGAPTTIVTGGADRQSSVRLALTQVDPGVRVIVIHDAARPFASPDLFTAVIEAVDDGVAGAIPVIPVADTVKRIEDGVVTDTLDREELGLAQTPQAFAASLLRAAHRSAAEADQAFTDDAAVMEHAGHRVRAITGDQLNTKITTLFDLAQAEARMGGVDG
jgi:2-C-methyl-D-erythritol 4-phosphate cytidylyltransferase